MTGGAFFSWVITLPPAILDPSCDSGLFSMESILERPLPCPVNTDLRLTSFMLCTT